MAQKGNGELRPSGQIKIPNVSKKAAIAEYERLRAEFGRQPSSREFFKVFRKRQLDYIFGADPFTKLVKAAGDKPVIPFHLRPGKWTKERSLESWGNTVRKLKHKPTQSDWMHYKFTPSVGWFDKYIGLWTDLPQSFLAFAENKPEWIDVVQMLKKDLPSVEPPTIEETSHSDDSLSWIPPIVKDLDNLSVTEGGGNAFEKKVNLAFQILGFSVTGLGQGTGRNSDGIAMNRENHYAIFIDSKARRDGYSSGTDDRAFIEYVKAGEGDLKRQGMTHLYFLVVSSRFIGTATRTISNLKKETNISAFGMLSSKLLLELVASRVRFPAGFNLKSFKDLLIQDGEIQKKKVEQWIENLKKPYS